MDNLSNSVLKKIEYFSYLSQLKDSDFSDIEKEDILNNTYQIINDTFKIDIVEYSKHHTLDSDDITNKIIKLLHKLNINHIYKFKDGGICYRFIYDLIESKFMIQNKLIEYSEEITAYKYLLKKYPNMKIIDNDFDEVIEFYKYINKNNINHFIFNTVTNIYINDKVQYKDIKNLLSILFYRKENFRYFETNDLKHNEFNNIGALLLGNFFNGYYPK